MTRLHSLIQTRRASGFTIVELLIVVVVIAILAAITIVAYNGIANRAKESALKSDLKNGATQIHVAKETTSAYPSDAGTLKKSDSTSFSSYAYTTSTFCLEASSSQLPGKYFYTTQAGTIQEGPCPAIPMQLITAANCSTNRARAYDVRDNHTYWVQKLADGKCWMLTNLAYAGGGTNTYSDTRVLTNSTASGVDSYTTAGYYVVPTGPNYTVEPGGIPSTSTTGTGQTGYFYNFCGANGGQAGNGACSNASSVAVNTTVSACPASWRLPTGGAGGELATLHTVVNGGASNDTGFRTTWLGQRAGYWSSGSFASGFGDYWSHTQISASNASSMYFDAGSVYATNGAVKTYAFAVRCVAI